MSQTKYLFFRSSRSATSQITELFDFTWATVVSYWNMQNEVKDWYLVNPNVTQEESYEKFIKSSGVHSINFKNSFLNPSWNEQESKFSKFILINIFAIYESWLSEVLAIIKEDKYVKEMQFPTGVSRSNKPIGIWPSINKICSQESKMLKDAFYITLLGHPKNSKNELDNLMKCLRYFKECRNALMHNGGIVSQNLVDAQREFSLVANCSDLRVTEVPIHILVNLNDPVKLSLRGIVGFCEIILKIIATCDAELSRAPNAEVEFIENWEKNGEKGRTIKSNLIKGNEQLKRYIRRLGYPDPVNMNHLRPFILNKKFASL